MNDLERLVDFLGEPPTVCGMPIAGLYFLFAQDELIYIGQSRDIAARLHMHRRRLQFDRAFYVKELNAIRRLAREAGLIGTFEPLGNQQSDLHRLAMLKRGDALRRVGKVMVRRGATH